ncbi:hypothetical protein BH10PSE19_BH10PSE19_17780 [soil metagenome]
MKNFTRLIVTSFLLFFTILASAQIDIKNLSAADENFISEAIKKEAGPKSAFDDKLIIQLATYCNDKEYDTVKSCIEALQKTPLSNSCDCRREDGTHSGYVFGIKFLGCNNETCR